MEGLSVDRRVRRLLQVVRYNMVARCHNPNHKNYHQYGARGVTVCEQWRNDSTDFIAWALANGYHRGLEIDRRDNNLGYEPDNCRWVPHSLNNINRRANQNRGHALYRGIRRRKCGRRQWSAQLTCNGKFHYGGSFFTAEEAARRYDEMVCEMLPGVEHPLNFPVEAA